MTEFMGFDNADADLPGIVILGADDTLDSADEQFWGLVVTEAWNNEWWYGDDGDPFDGASWSDVQDEFRAWAIAKIEPPVWRWYVWGPDPDGGDREVLTQADPHPGAFWGAVVRFKATTVDGTR